MIDENNKLSLRLNGSGGSFGGIGDVCTKNNSNSFNTSRMVSGFSPIGAGPANSFYVLGGIRTVNGRSFQDWTFIDTEGGVSYSGSTFIGMVTPLGDLF